MTFTRRGVTITSLPHRDKRFTPTTPPPTGRPTRRHTTRSSSGSGGHTDDSNGGHTDGEPPRQDPAEAAVDPDPPPEVNLPF